MGGRGELIDLIVVFCENQRFMSHDLFPHRNKYNLNAISHDTAMALIRQVLSDGVNLREVSVCVFC